MRWCLKACGWKRAGETVDTATDSFPQIEERFARLNNCPSCRHRSIHRNYEICMQGYDRLLAAYAQRTPFDLHCDLRE